MLLCAARPVATARRPSSSGISAGVPFADGGGEVLVLDVAGAEVGPGVLDAGVPDAPHIDALAGARRLAPGVAPAPVLAPAVAQRQAGQQAFQLAFVADDDDMFVVGAALGEHAQVQHGARAAGVLDDHVGAVQDVGRARAVGAVVAFVQVVHTLAAAGEHPQRLFAQDEVHQVEVVAALLDQRAAGVGREAVPVVHLGVERFAVFADGHLVHAPDAAFMGDADHLGHRRHVAVFLRHPDDAAAAFGAAHQFHAVFDARDQRLFDQDVQAVQRQRVAQHLDMGEVGRGDHHRVAQAAAPAARGGSRRPAAGAAAAGQRGVAAGGVRVGQRGDHVSAAHGLQVLDVLAAHAAAADDAVAK